MAGRFDGTRTLVFGAAGTIGKEIVLDILGEGGKVAAVYKNRKQAEASTPDLPELEKHFCNVESIPQLTQLARSFLDSIRSFDHLIYTVGHCPPGDFERQVSRNLMSLDDQTLEDDFGILVTGLLNVYREFTHLLNARGRILVVGSAITRFPVTDLPPWLNAGSYYIAQNAQRNLVEWIRREDDLLSREIGVIRLAFGAINTPFHAGSIPTHVPPKMLELKQVVAEIINALKSETPLDWDILA
ncbi:MAG: SDR family oxidoreductase [Candidatus Paceibacterota bacterium]|jgi:NAD(P)-dependent dehydrogenase (short-subunit alcohol dehydrogenase family)